ncbi:MAG: type IV pilus twitching motility protein PilT [Bacillota bacterium]
MHMQALLGVAVERRASDLHLTVGAPPVLRVHGEMVRLEGAELRPEDTAALAAEVLPDKLRSRFDEAGEVDFAFGLEGLGRFRCNVFRQRGKVALAVRVLSEKVPDLATLGLPPVVAELAFKPDGLVLVTGRTGSGKSTTLAAMVELINQKRSGHIITLEDPIEYFHRHGQCIVNQREIGADSDSFAAALRAALREDPDVILVGELRDVETMAIALTAAETGHLVLSTLHTISAPGAIDRLVDAFPPHQQAQVRTQLALVLQGVVAQRLLARSDRAGRVAACEVLVATTAVRNLIREGKSHQLVSAIQTGARYGMVSLEASLKELVERDVMSPAQYRKLMAAERSGEAGSDGDW